MKHENLDMTKYVYYCSSCSGIFLTKTEIQSGSANSARSTCRFGLDSSGWV